MKTGALSRWWAVSVALLAMIAGHGAAVAEQGEVAGLPQSLATELGYGIPGVWGRAPIQLLLGVGKERRMSFPGPVKVKIPTLRQESLTLRNISQTLYWTATEAFPRTEVLVQRLDNGETYVLDVTATEADVDAYPLYVDQPTEKTPSATKTPARTVRVPGRPRTKTTLYGRYRALTRYAAHQLYAPERLRLASPRIGSAPVKGTADHLLRGSRVKAKPLASWTDGALFVTAVALTNALDEPIVLDPRDLRGQWLAATFQHVRLFAKGDGADTTAVYLVSQVPFEEAAP